MSENKDQVWEKLRKEALDTADVEPALQSLLSEVILNQTCLEHALATRLSRKLADHSTSETYLKDIFLEAFNNDESISQRIREDIIATLERDPACETYLCPFLYFKGFQALSCYRIANYYWHQNRNHLALYLQSLISEVLSVDIHPAAKIGGGILLDHATGFVAGETCVIDDNVSILHAVTLGGTGKDTTRSWRWILAYS